MKRSVGLLVAVRLEGELYIALQRRGKWKWKKGKLEKESYPGGCQVLAHGGLEDGEDFLAALMREMREELGIRFRDVVLHEHDRGNVQLLHSIQTEEQEVQTFGLQMEPYLLEVIQFHAGTGGLELVTRHHHLRNLKDPCFSKQYGVTDREIYALFPDEIEAVKKAFERYSS